MSYLELVEKLRELDEVLLMELLNVTSTDLVDMFPDKIKENETYIRQEIEE